MRRPTIFDIGIMEVLHTNADDFESGGQRFFRRKLRTEKRHAGPITPLLQKNKCKCETARRRLSSTL